MKKYLIVLLIALAFIMTGCSKDENKIVIYTAMEEERIQAMNSQLKEKFPELNVVTEAVGTGNLAAKIKTEKENIEADIIVDLEFAHMENLKDNFADLSDFDQSMYVNGINPTHNKYFMWVKNYCGITINKTYFEENNLSIPTSYEDLLNEEYNDLIAIPDPSTSGTGYSYYLNLTNIYGTDDTLTYFDNLSKNVKQYTTSGSGPISLLKQGEIAIAMGMTFQGVAEINNGANYEIISLNTGTPYNMTGVAIIEGREKNQNVIDVFNWLINDFIKYDNENFVPGNILNNFDNKVPNWPTNIVDADMTGLESISIKEELIEKWDR